VSILLFVITKLISQYIHFILEDNFVTSPSQVSKVKETEGSQVGDDGVMEQEVQQRQKTPSEYRRISPHLKEKDSSKILTPVAVTAVYQITRKRKPEGAGSHDVIAVLQVYKSKGNAFFRASAS
jgi:hypothetical protein